MSFHPLYENYHALHLAINAPIYLSPDGAFLSLACSQIHRGRATKRVSKKDALEMKALSETMSYEKIATLYGLSVEAICDHIKEIKSSKGRAAI